MNPKRGDIIQIHSYKHNKDLHRIWEKVKILHIDEDIIIAGNNKTKVIETDGKIWTTKEPAICYFFKKKWFNVIGMLKKDGIHYYSNIASPAIWDGEAIKYIDYDLDIMLFPNGNYKVLDKKEYDIHKEEMNYSKDLKTVIEGQLEILKNYINNKKTPFEDEFIKKWYKIYKES